MVHLKEDTSQEALKEVLLVVQRAAAVLPLKDINLEVSVVPLIAQVRNPQVTLEIIQMATQAAVDGLTKIIIKTLAQQSVPLYQYLFQFPLEEDIIMVALATAAA